MNFKASDFVGYNTDCSTIRAMVKWAKEKKQFTMEDFETAFPSSNVSIQSMRYMKPPIMKQYVEEYMKDKGFKMLEEMVDRYNSREREFRSAKPEIDKIKAQLNRQIEEYNVKLFNLKDVKAGNVNMPPVRSILSEFYSSAQRDVTALNSLLQDVLNQCIRGQVDFHVDDIAWVYENCKGGYWFNQSGNGKSRGEHFYSLACIFNPSAAQSYERFDNRVPFIVKSHKLFTGINFKLDDVYYTVTGWTSSSGKHADEKDIMTAVGYEKPDNNQNPKERGKRTLRKFNRKDWLEERKKIELLSDYSFHGRWG